MKMLYRAADWLRHRARLKQDDPAHAWGKRGEDLAHRYLQAQGCVILARNHRTRGGTAEVDLIARDGSALVFVEVKTRASELFGTPEEAVDAEKQTRIVKGAADYIHRTGESWDHARFDIVSVLFGEQESIRHHRDAFRPLSPL